MKFGYLLLLSLFLTLSYSAQINISMNNTVVNITVPGIIQPNYTQLSVQQSFINLNATKNGCLPCGQIFLYNAVIPYGFIHNLSTVNVGSSLFFFDKQQITVNQTYTKATNTFVSQNQENETTIYNISIGKATPNCTIRINNNSYSTGGSYPLPVAIYNGHVGSTGSPNIWLNGSYSCGNLNTLPLNFSTRFRNGTYKTHQINNLTKSLSSTFNILANVTNPPTFTLETNGNNNYSSLDPIVHPTSIDCYENISIQNLQATNTGHGLQIKIDANTLAFPTCYGNPFFDGTANNIEFYYNNGTVVSSWLEGNVVNGIQTTGLNTVTDLVYWINYFPTILTGATNTNTISIGSNTNYVNLFGGTNGENPVLSSYTGTDTGNLVFYSFYDNFSGTSLSGLWALKQGTATVNNGLHLLGGASGGTISSKLTYQVPLNSIDFYGYTTDHSAGGGTPNAWVGWYNFANNAFAVGDFGTIGALYKFQAAWTMPGSFTWSETGQQILTLTNSINLQANYIVQVSSPMHFTNTANVYAQAFGNGQDWWINWIRMRKMAPSNVLPTVTFSNIQLVSVPPRLGITTNPLNFGFTDIITVNAIQPVTDTIDLYANSITTYNVLLAATSNSYTYVFYSNFSAPAIGNYFIVAKDLSTGLSSTPQILTVVNTTDSPGTDPSSANPLYLLIPSDNMTEELALFVIAGIFFYMYLNDKQEHLKLLWIVLALLITGFGFITQTGIISLTTNTLNGNTTITPTYGQIPVNPNQNNIVNFFVVTWIILFFLFLIGMVKSFANLIRGTGDNLKEKARNKP